MTNEKIFISYRRTDAAGYAGRLFDRLSARFGDENIFMDVEDLDPGVDFVEKLEEAVAVCDLLVALIGLRWLDAANEKGQRRLDNPEDFVRVEIAAALDRDVRVIPILVQGSRMPGTGDLPDAINRLSRLNAFEIRHERFNADVDRLTRAIEDYFEENARRLEREAADKEAAREKAESEQHAREIAQQEAHLAAYLESANSAMGAKDWQTAQSNYANLLKLRPDHIEAQEGLQTASRNLKLDQLYGQAILQQDEGQLETALETLKSIQKLDEHYRDVSRLIDAIDNLLVQKSAQAEIDRKRTSLARSRKRKRILKYSTGIIGLALMVVLVLWGGGKLINDWRDTGTILPAKEPSAGDTIPAIELESFILDDYDVPMALIAAGPFEMGNDNGDRDEKPRHAVYLDNYYIDQYEVTVGRYAECVDGGICEPPFQARSDSRNSYYGNSTYSDYPVIHVSWVNALTYCQWRGGRLPSEAEWEKAARGGLVGAAFPWGNDPPDCSKANYGGDDCRGDTREVGKYAPNNYQLYDMAGNVWEWTQSLYEDYPYDPSGVRENPRGDGRRVLRGGSWNVEGDNLRAALRIFGFELYSNDSYGFRCARSP